MTQKTLFLAAVIPAVPFFVLTSYSFYTQLMLIFILINVQYSQNVVISFEKVSTFILQKISAAKFSIPYTGGIPHTP